jgi:hypothetical protein
MNKTNLLLDFGIFAGLLVMAAPGLTGLPVHEWLGAAFAGAILAHLLLHWKWIVEVGLKFFRRLFHQSRLQFVIDSALFIAFIAVMLSGLMISRTVLALIGIASARNSLWNPIHNLSANAVVLLAGLHFATHWSWVVAMTQRHLLSPIAAIFTARKQPEAAPVTVRTNHITTD